MLLQVFHLWRIYSMVQVLQWLLKYPDYRENKLNLGLWEPVSQSLLEARSFLSMRDDKQRITCGRASGPQACQGSLTALRTGTGFSETQTSKLETLSQSTGFWSWIWHKQATWPWASWPFWASAFLPRRYNILIEWSLTPLLECYIANKFSAICCCCL